MIQADKVRNDIQFLVLGDKQLRGAQDQKGNRESMRRYDGLESVNPVEVVFEHQPQAHDPVSIDFSANDKGNPAAAK